MVPAYSADGVTWTKIPHIASPPDLPAGWPDGWYRDASSTLHILTRHATYFALLTQQSTAINALRLTFSTASRIDLGRTQKLVLKVRSTLPAQLALTLTRGGTRLGSWHPTVNATNRTITVFLPRVALHAGRRTLVLRATTASEVADAAVALTFVARR
jgi:hypothetical protein